MKKSNKPLTPEEEVTPLFIKYPEYEQPIKSYLGVLGIKKRVDFFIRESAIPNAHALGNLKYGIVIINDSLLSSAKKDVIMAVVCHELYHVKNWSIHFINFEIQKLILCYYSKIFEVINEKANHSRIARLLTINQLTTIWVFTTYIFLLYLLIISNFYRMLVDEVFADKLAVDLTNSRSIIKVFKYDKQEDTSYNFFEDVLFHTHLPTILRHKLVNLYYYWKYLRPDWERNRLVFILKSIAVVITFMIIVKSLQYVIPLVLNSLLDVVVTKWNILFNGDKYKSLFSFVGIITGGGVIWNIVSLFKAFRTKRVLAEKLRVTSIISLLLLFCISSITFIFPIYKSLLIPTIFFAFIMNMVTILFNKYLDWKLKKF